MSDINKLRLQSAREEEFTVICAANRAVILARFVQHALKGLGDREGDAEQRRLEPVQRISAEVSSRDARLGLAGVAGYRVDDTLFDTGERHPGFHCVAEAVRAFGRTCQPRQPIVQITVSG